MEFKNYLVTEQRNYLGDKVGDLLTGVHELIAGGKQVGARLLLKHCEGIANNIRRILHSTWPRTEYKYLRRLQKCGVALMKAIETKGDLGEVLESVRRELEDISHQIGAPLNALGTKKQ